MEQRNHPRPRPAFADADVPFEKTAGRAVRAHERAVGGLDAIDLFDLQRGLFGERRYRRDPKRLCPLFLCVRGDPPWRGLLCVAAVPMRDWKYGTDGQLIAAADGRGPRRPLRFAEGEMVLLDDRTAALWKQTMIAEGWT